MDPAVAAAATGPVSDEHDVDHGEAGADQQDVGRAGRVTAYDVEGAGRPRIGDEERGAATAVRCPGEPGARSPVARTTASARCTWPSSVVDEDAGVVATDARSARDAQVAQPERVVAGVGVGQGLVEVARPLDPRREDAGLGHQLGVLARPPGDEVSGLLRAGRSCRRPATLSRCCGSVVPKAVPRAR